MGFKVILYTTGVINLGYNRVQLQDYKIMQVEVTALDSEKLLNLNFKEYFENEANLLVVVTNVIMDSRHRILLVKNKLTQMRREYLKKAREKEEAR